MLTAFNVFLVLVGIIGYVAGLVLLLDLLTGNDRHQWFQYACGTLLGLWLAYPLFLFLTVALSGSSTKLNTGRLVTTGIGMFAFSIAASLAGGSLIWSTLRPLVRRRRIPPMLVRLCVFAWGILAMAPSAGIVRAVTYELGITQYEFDDRVRELLDKNARSSVVHYEACRDAWIQLGQAVHSPKCPRLELKWSPFAWFFGEWQVVTATGDAVPWPGKLRFSRSRTTRDMPVPIHHLTFFPTVGSSCRTLVPLDEAHSFDTSGIDLRVLAHVVDRQRDEFQNMAKQEATHPSGLLVFSYVATVDEIPFSKLEMKPIGRNSELVDRVVKWIHLAISLSIALFPRRGQ